MYCNTTDHGNTLVGNASGALHSLRCFNAVSGKLMNRVVTSNFSVPGCIWWKSKIPLSTHGLLFTKISYIFDSFNKILHFLICWVLGSGAKTDAYTGGSEVNARLCRSPPPTVATTLVMEISLKFYTCFCTSVFCSWCLVDISVDCHLVLVLFSMFICLSVSGVCVWCFCLFANSKICEYVSLYLAFTLSGPPLPYRFLNQFLSPVSFSLH